MSILGEDPKVGLVGGSIPTYDLKKILQWIKKEKVLIVLTI